MWQELLIPFRNSTVNSLGSLLDCSEALLRPFELNARLGL